MRKRNNAPGRESAQRVSKDRHIILNLLLEVMNLCERCTCIINLCLLTIIKASTSLYNLVSTKFLYTEKSAQHIYNLRLIIHSKIDNNCIILRKI